MTIQKFTFGTDDGIEYELIVVEGRGFYLRDAKTDELLLDASVLINGGGELHHWPVEIVASHTNRDFYFRYLPQDGDTIEFGISRRQ